jgi:phospholipase/carboxylesterase
MKVDQQKGRDLHYLTIYPDNYQPEYTYPLVIMLHGFGANMKDLAGLAPAIERQRYVYACPNAPVPFDLGLGMVGYGWHPRKEEATPEDYRRAEVALNGFLDEVMEQLKSAPGEIVLLGFSQGGGMTYRCGLCRPETFAGLAALSASLPDPSDLKKKLPQARNQPIFIAHGTSDPLVPLDSARATRTFLEGAGYSPEYHEYAMGHEIPPAVLQDLVPWLNRVLPPLRPD